MGFRKGEEFLPRADIGANAAKWGSVRIAVIEPLKCCAPLAMSASGKLHCGVATIRQWLVWADYCLHISNNRRTFRRLAMASLELE